MKRYPLYEFTENRRTYRSTDASELIFFISDTFGYDPMTLIFSLETIEQVGESHVNVPVGLYEICGESVSVQKF